MTLNTFMALAVDFTLNLLLIVLLLAVIYAVIWTAIFYPVIKLRKHNKQVYEMEKKHNKIQVEYAATAQLQETTDAKLRTVLYQLHQKEKQLQSLDEQITAKTKQLEKKK